jgi:hypothetical protein
MLFIPNLHCTIYPQTGLDLYGKPVFGDPIKEKCAIVKLDVVAMKTTVRADSSASRGAADELTSMARILFTNTSKVQIGDKIIVAGQDLKVLSKFPRYSIDGEFDHWQVDAGIWGDGEAFGN